MERVAPSQRHSRANPCKVCGGGRDDPHGRGVRCYGFLSDDERYEHCTREEFAGDLQPDPDGTSWAHRLDGPCACGVTHVDVPTIPRADADEKPRQVCKYESLPTTQPGGYRLTAMHPYPSARGEPHRFEVRRFDLPDGSDKTYRPYSQRDDGLWVEARIGDWPMFGLPDLRDAPLGDPVLIPEGEKCANAARAALRAAGYGWPVTTTAGGAKSGHMTTLDALRGRVVVVLPDNDKDGERYRDTIEKRAKEAGAAKVVTLRLVGLKSPKDDIVEWLAAGHDGAELAQLVTRALDAGKPQPISVSMDTVTPKKVSWLWPGRIPLGKITTFDGDPGLGKSTIGAEFAAHVTTGTEWPDGSPCPQGGVVLLSAEDDNGDTIRPRLDAAGAKVSRISHLTGVSVTDENGATKEYDISLPRDLAVLEDEIRRRRALLLIIDPLMAFLSGDVNSYRDQDVRGALRPLKDIAERTGCAIVLVRHLSKAPGGNAIYRGGGSIGIIGAARSGLIVGPDPDDPESATPSGWRVLAVSKINVGMAAPSIKYRVISALDGEVGRIEWGEVSTHSANDLLTTPPDDDERSLIDDAMDYLRNALSAGAQTVKDLLDGAPYDLRGRDNHPSKPMKAAKKRLGIIHRRKGFGPDSCVEWELPSEALIPHRGPQTPIGDHQVDRAPMDSEVPYGVPEGCERPNHCARRVINGRVTCGLGCQQILG